MLWTAWQLAVEDKHVSLKGLKHLIFFESNPVTCRSQSPERAGNEWDEIDYHHDGVNIEGSMRWYRLDAREFTKQASFDVTFMIPSISYQVRLC